MPAQTLQLSMCHMCATPHFDTCIVIDISPSLFKIVEALFKLAMSIWCWACFAGGSA